MEMTPEEYLQGVMRTANTKLPVAIQLENCMLSLQGEWGEVANYIKKVRYHGKPFDENKLIDELGDCLFYIFWLCKCVDKHFNGNPFYSYFERRFDTYWKESNNREDDILDTSHAVLQALVVLSARIGMFFDNFVSTTTIKSIWVENIEKSCMDFIRNLGLFSMQCGVICSWEYVARKNQEKLFQRYPDGFSIAASENRSI